MQKATSIQQRLFSIFLVTIMLLALVSCQKETTTNPPPAPATAKIKEYKNGYEFVRFTYNADGSIKKATIKSELNTGDDVIDFNITYNTQKKIAEVTTAHGERIVPEYANGVMTRANVFDGPIRTSYTNYLYEGSVLKKATIYMNQGADFEPLLEFQFAYNAGGNLAESLVLMATGVSGQLVRAGHIAYQFDQKQNPLYEHRDFLALLWQGVSKNNITREEHFDAGQNLEDIYTYLYTYKANGLPEHAVVTTELPGQPPATTNLDFIYQ